MSRDAIALSLAVVLAVFIIIVTFAALSHGQYYYEQKPFQFPAWIYGGTKTGQLPLDIEYQLQERWGRKHQREWAKELRRRWSR